MGDFFTGEEDFFSALLGLRSDEEDFRSCERLKIK